MNFDASLQPNQGCKCSILQAPLEQSKFEIIDTWKHGSDVGRRYGALNGDCECCTALVGILIVLRILKPPCANTWRSSMCCTNCGVPILFHVLQLPAFNGSCLCAALLASSAIYALSPANSQTGCMATLRFVLIVSEVCTCSHVLDMFARSCTIAQGCVPQCVVQI